MPKRKKLYRVRFIEDPDARFEESNGEARPLTEEEYTGNEYQQDGKTIPYAEYRRYYGNPKRHVYLSCEAQSCCPCCGEWESWAGGLHGIDFMDDSPELRAVGAYYDSKRATWFTPEEVEQLPGYLRECALSTLGEAGYTLPKTIYCIVPKCGYWHQVRDPKYAPTVDERYCAEHQPKEAP